MFQSKVNLLGLVTLKCNNRRSLIPSLTSLKRFSKFMEKSAGIIIIGDEILKGHTQDINSFHMCQLLHSLGVRVKKVTVIGDNLDVISSEVRHFSDTYDFVLTSGGIGPTHDDLTFEGVASAFGETTTAHPTLLELCHKYFGKKALSTAELKLAQVPPSAELHFAIDAAKGEPFKYPLISVKNVYIFPGIPVLLRRLIDNLGHLFKSDQSFHVETLLIDAFETDIASTLTTCDSKFKDAGINIGSYPDWFNNYYKVKLIVESANKDATEAATSYLRQNFDRKLIVDNYVSNPVGLLGEDVFGENLKTRYPLLNQKILASMAILEEAFGQYSPESICIGFNGGKDCTALLHLYYAFICRKYPHCKGKLQAVYIKDEHPFEELEAFMHETNRRYNLQIITLEGNMKDALGQMHRDKPVIKAVVMGTRYTDPYSRNLTAFSPTDSDWPPLMRINPILNWTYHEIWIFLRALYLPYCVLYDRGYTSLGNRETTHRNEKLVTTDRDGNTRYAPAYTLKDQDFERNGRL